MRSKMKMSETWTLFRSLCSLSMFYKLLWTKEHKITIAHHKTTNVTKSTANVFILYDELFSIYSQTNFMWHFAPFSWKQSYYWRWRWCKQSVSLRESRVTWWRRTGRKAPGRCQYSRHHQWASPVGYADKSHEVSRKVTFSLEVMTLTCITSLKPNTTHIWAENMSVRVLLFACCMPAALCVGKIPVNDGNIHASFH